MRIDFQEITHLLVDLDGTLVNSLKRLKYVYDDFLNEHDKRGSEEEFSTLKTTSIERMIETLKKNHLLSLPSLELKKQYEAYLEKHYFKAPLFYGAKKCLEQLHQRGVRLILTSACQKAIAKRVLTSHQIHTYFDEVYTPPCFGYKTKDAPFYSKVIETLKIDKKQALVIDDSVEVIAAAACLKINALLFSKINYHPLPCFGSWRSFVREWSAHDSSLPS